MLAGPRGSVQDHLAAKGYLGFVILNKQKIQYKGRYQNCITWHIFKYGVFNTTPTGRGQKTLKGTENI